MENHHVSWENPLFLWWFSHQFFASQESTINYSDFIQIAGSPFQGAFGRHSSPGSCKIHSTWRGKYENLDVWDSKTKNLVISCYIMLYHVISRYFVNESCGQCGGVLGHWKHVHSWIAAWVLLFDLFVRFCSAMSQTFSNSTTKTHGFSHMSRAKNGRRPVIVNRAKNAKLVYSMGVFPGCADHPKMAKQHSPWNGCRSRAIIHPTCPTTAQPTIQNSYDMRQGSLGCWFRMFGALKMGSDGDNFLRPTQNLNSTNHARERERESLRFSFRDMLW